MIVYELHISPDEYESDDKDCDEWFSSLRAAKKRRAELIKEYPTKEGQRFDSDFSIDRVVISSLPHRDLVLALLNGSGFIRSKETVVEPYVFLPKPEEEV